MTDTPHRKDLEELIEGNDYDSYISKMKRIIPLDLCGTNYEDLFGKSPNKFRIPKEKTPSKISIPEASKSREQILAPLERVFFDDELMNELVVRTSIPELLERKAPVYQGVILFGPGGTGKSVFQEAVCNIYENAGAYSKQVSSSAVNSCFVSMLAKNLEEELQRAQAKGEARKMPSFLSFDEGSIFAQQASKGSSSVSKHYQEAIDVFKRYLGNDAGKWLVVAISTNLLPEDFEAPMVREGRLSSYFIGYPSQEQTARMWQYFLKDKKVLEIGDEQAMQLSELSQREQGAFIEEFSSAYLNHRRQKILEERGYSSVLDSLRKGVHIPDGEVAKSVNFEAVKQDLTTYLIAKYQRLEQNGDKKRKEQIGFSVQ